jgi:aryl-phospho-beta-D-glucosidase BglC (GH1 family)
LENEKQPGTLNEKGMDYVRKGLDWCLDSGLKVILDLHKAPGFSFDHFQAATLFNDASLQARFLNLWQTLAISLRDSADFVAFELLNEIVLPDSNPWNVLVHKTVDCIRAIDKDRLIVIGGNYYNSASQLINLETMTDPNILYTFHFYEPMVITHQKAKWVKALLDYNQVAEYPGVASNLDEFLKLKPEYQNFLGPYVAKPLDKLTLLAYVQPALDFTRTNEKVVYCGEFGVIECAPLRTRINWTRDFISILHENKIGRAYWSYKGVDFGLIDRAGKVVSNELIKIVCAH